MRFSATKDHRCLPRVIHYFYDLCRRIKVHRLYLLVVPLLLAYRLITLNSAKWSTDLVILPLNHKLLRFASSQLSFIADAPAENDNRKNKEESFERILKSHHTSYTGLFQDNDNWQNRNQNRCNQSHIHIRAFPRYEPPFPCFAAEEDWNTTETAQRQPAHQGFFYVKTYKTASTTVTGVVIRIALKMAERYNQRYRTNFASCKARFEHWPAFRLQYRMRERDESFLFAILREPTRRAISMFFHFRVTREMEQPLDETFQHFLTSIPAPDPWYPDYNPWGSTMDHYLHFLSTDGFDYGSEGKQSIGRRIETVNKILNDYDFIGITERLDESLVAMQIILGLKTSDILYYSAKHKGSWDDHGFYIQPSFVSEGMEEFFSSETWRELSKGDYMMYLAANASLDRTIDSLGQEEFEEKLVLFRYAKDFVVTNCTNIKLLYSAAGVTQDNDCLYGDAGCGSKCFDRIEKDWQL